MRYKSSLKQSLTDTIHHKKYLATFNNYLNLSREILNNDFCNLYIPNSRHRLNALNKVIRILSLEIQNNIISHVINNEKNYMFNPIFSTTGFFCPKCSEIKNYNTEPLRLSPSIPFNLNTNPTISACWNKGRLINALGNLGIHVNRPFTFDKVNHFGSILIIPINLLLIGNGYHSSTSGIYTENSIYYPEYLLDITSWYQEIIFDGITFRHVPCKTVLHSPEQKEIGIIYEIGRLLVENHLNLFSLHTS